MKPQVVIGRCSSYDRKRVYETVAAAVDRLGGITAFVARGQRVLIKPNMLSARAPDQGVTTHPAVLEAVIRLVQGAGATAIVGDSPSGAIKGVQRCWRKTGFEAVCRDLGVALVNFEADGSAERSINGNRYHIARSVLEADAVINLPKMKTHGFTLFTGAVKNLFGTLPGFQKANYHKLYPHPGEFSTRLVDIYQCINPVLTVMDGITAMEGHGPATGSLVQANLLLAAADGIALDAVAADIMGFREGEIDALRIAAERGAGVADISSIETITLDGSPVPKISFSLPSNRLMKAVPAALVRLAGRLIWVRPTVNRDLCISCGICAESCPVEAIEMVDGLPKIDYTECINCLCCNESCSAGAVYQKLSWFAEKIG
ncbi:DUF362 domain-containing protein [bacterium]|nr:DUF362 domain-containing protein [bacterium]